MIDLNDTPYTKVVNTLVVPIKHVHLFKHVTVIGDSYVKENEFYAIDSDGHVHWFEYKGKLAKDMEPLF